MECPIPQPGQCEKPSQVNTHKEDSDLCSSRKKRVINAVNQNNNSSCAYTHLNKYFSESFFMIVFILLYISWLKNKRRDREAQS